MAYGRRNNRRFGGNTRGRSYGRGRGRGRRKQVDVAGYIQKAAVSAAHASEAVIVDTSFSDFRLNPQLLTNLAKMGFVRPTPIQQESLRHVIDGKDVIGLANTGTGKTAAFLLPLLHRLAEGKRERTLIMAPTRELAAQIEKELRSLRQGIRAYSVLVIGGNSINRQINDLRRPHDFVIGTPGRLKDLADKKKLNLDGFDNVVLDEVDRMMDMGFLPGIKYLLGKMPHQRQSLFFSATLSAQIHALVSQFSNDPETVSVKTQEVTGNVEQVAMPVQETKKFTTLVDMLGKSEFEKVLVFGRTKHGVKRLAIQLADRGFRSESIHGNKTQNNRKRALDAFRTNRINVLVATDVASRGIDVADITHVINYDAPETYEDYVHRIGRTGRAESKGVAVTFVS